MDFVTLGNFMDKYGLPIIELCIGGWVIREVTVKAIWPYFLTTQAQNRADREQERKDRIMERDLFLASLGSLNATILTRDAQQHSTMSDISQSIKTMLEEMQKINLGRRASERK